MDNIKDILLLITGAGINIASGYFLTKNQLKKEKYLDNKRKIDTAYEDIYKVLLKLRGYYYFFIESRNEFKESEDWKNFSPLPIISEFFSEIEKKEIFLDKNFMKEFEKVKESINSHPSMALSMAINPEPYFETIVEESAINALKAIDIFKDYMRKRFEENI